jgi:hypothetical protein
MPTQVQFRRGTTAQNNNFIGAAGEISVDLDRMVLRVHDGVTAGGTAMLTTSGTATNAVNIVGGTQGDVPYQDSTGVTRFINIGAAGQVLSSNGTTATWVDVGSLTGGGGISADDVFVSTQTSGDRYLVVADQNGNYVALEADSGTNAAVYNLATGLAVNSTLTVSKAILPSASGIDIGSLANPFRSLYVTSGTVYVGGIAIEDINGSLTVNNQVVVTTATIGTLVASTATNIGGGTAGQIVYQTAPGATSFAGPGNLGEIIVSGGAAAPVYTSTSSIYVGNAAVANALNAANTSTQYVGFANIAASVLAANTSSQQVGFAANLLGGAAGGLPYQSGPAATTFLTIGAGNTVLTSNGSAPVWSTALSLSGNLTVGGNLTVNGTTTYVNSTVTNIVDPIITIGGAADGQPSPSDDNKDRGIAFRWYTSGAAKTGFFGFDDSSGFFTFVSDATISGGEVMSGTKGAANINIAGGSTGQILYQSAANETGFIGPGSVGQILVSAGSAIPVYTSTGSIYVGYAGQADSINPLNTSTQKVGFADVAGSLLAANTTTQKVGFADVAGSLLAANTTTQKVGFADVAGRLLAANTSTQQVGLAANLMAGSAGSLPYQTGANATGMLALGSTGFVLVAGASAPEWASLGTISASTATNLAGGTAGQVPYQTAAGATSFYGPGTLGQILVSSGASAPTYTNTASIYVGNAAVANALNAGNTGTQKVGFADVAGTILAANTGSIYVGNAAVANILNAGNTSTQQVGFAANVLAGAAGSLVYQSAANATAMLNIGAANSILVSNGSTPSWSTSPSIGGDLTVGGNLTVNGTTTYVNSTVTNVSDPIITIGGGTNGAAPTSNDSKDRGIAFQWHNGTAAKVGFFGYDSSVAKFLFVPDATITNEVVTGTKGALDANLAGGTAGQLVYQSGVDTTAFTGPGTAGQLLMSAGASAPVYTNTASIYVGNAAVANTLNAGNTSTQQVGFADVAGRLLAANTSTQQVGLAANVMAGAAGSLVYQTGANATGMLALGSTGFVLVAGASAPQWASLGTISANTATNIAGGTAGQLVYQSAPGVTTFAGPGTAGQILVSAGTSAPTYTNTASIYVGNAAVANILNAGNTSTQLVGFADNAGKWKTARTVTFTGDVTGSFTIDGSADVSAVALTVGSNTVTLGTDTTGDYVSNGATAGFGISGSTTGETQTFTVTSNATSTNATSTLVFRDSTGGFSAGNVSVRDTTASSSTSTGALKVEGGVGIGGNLYVGGEIVAQKLTIQFTTVTTTLVQTDDVIQTLNTTQAVSTITGALQIAGGAGIGGNAYIGGNANVAGTVTHNGLVPTAGTAIDQIYTSTKSLTLTNAWQDTGISGTDLATGSYMIQVFANDSSVGGGHINMYYTGVMSWFSTAAGENSYSEIVLNRAGNAAAAGTIFLRVAEVNLGTLKLQISGTTINSGASNYAFSFRRMI